MVERFTIDSYIDEEQGTALESDFAVGFGDEAD
jgi:hypothetical protein